MSRRMNMPALDSPPAGTKKPKGEIKCSVGGGVRVVDPRSCIEPNLQSTSGRLEQLEGIGQHIHATRSRGHSR